MGFDDMFIQLCIAAYKKRNKEIVERLHTPFPFLEKATSEFLSPRVAETFLM